MVTNRLFRALSKGSYGWASRNEDKLTKLKKVADIREIFIKEFQFEKKTRQNNKSK